MKMRSTSHAKPLGRANGLVMFCVTVILTLSFVLGCAGEGGGISGSILANYFSAAYSRAGFTGTVLFRQAADGSLTIVVNEEDGQYSGTAVPSKAPGDFSGTLTRAGATPLSVTGNVAGAMITGAVTGTVKGNPVNSPFTANNVAANVSGNPFAGSYTGTYSGDGSGTFTMTVSATGAISGKVMVEGETVNGSGQLSNLGGGDFTASGSGTVGTAKFTGVFQFVGGKKVATGVWMSDGGSGSWTGSSSP